jgi:hypothetical protein
MVAAWPGGGFKTWSLDCVSAGGTCVFADDAGEPGGLLKDYTIRSESVKRVDKRPGAGLCIHSRASGQGCYPWGSEAR